MRMIQHIKERLVFMKGWVLMVFSLALFGGVSIAPSHAAIEIGENLNLNGDFRFRFEQDFDRTDRTGSDQGARDRIRMRLRLGFTYDWSEHTEFGGRLRTGNRLDQQSPHQTFGDDFEPKEINIDKAYLRYKRGNYWLWVGKNSKPFWTQNELFWDDDINPEGIALFYSFKDLIEQDVSINAGYLVLQGTGSTSSVSDWSTLTHVQAVGKAGIEPVDLTLAAGFYNFLAKTDSTTADALQGLDFGIFGISGQGKVKTLPILITLGFDYLKNVKDYQPTDTIYGDPVLNGEDTGYVISLILGKLKEKGDWVLGYYYAHIEQMAVVGLLAQDDWWRISTPLVDGGANTRSNNIQGHEVRAGYAFGKGYSILARYYKVKEIEVPTGSQKEEANRWRLDLNIQF